MNRMLTGSALLLMLLLLASCLAADDANLTATSVPDRPVATAENQPPVASLTATGIPVARFDATATAAPQATAVPPLGVVYKLVEQVGLPRIPQAPMDVALLGNGDFVVSDAGRREIQIFTPALELRTSWPAMAVQPFEDEPRQTAPEQIAVLGDSFFAGIPDAAGIAQYNSDGALVAQYSLGESGLSLLDLQAGPDGRLYGAVGTFLAGLESTSLQVGIYVFDDELNLLEIWEPASGWMPLALDFDAYGLLHTLALPEGEIVARSAALVAIDPSSYSAAVWDEIIEVQLEGVASGLAVTAGGDYVVASKPGNIEIDNVSLAISILGPDGTERGSWVVEGYRPLITQSAIGLLVTALPEAPGASGEIVLADPLGQRLLLFDLDGAPAGELVDNPAHLSSPSGIAVLPGGELAVLDIPAGVISIFDADRSASQRFQADMQILHPGLAPLGRLFAGNDNDLWYLAPGGMREDGLQRLDLETGLSEAGSIGVSNSEAPPLGPHSGTVGPDGLLYLALLDGTAGSFSLDGEQIDRWPAVENGQVQHIAGVATGFDRVYLLWEGELDDRNGLFVSRYGDDPNDIFIDLQATDSGSLAPNAIEVGPDGAIYLLDPFSNAVLIFNAGGELISRWAVGAGVIMQVIDIAVDEEGRVYLADIERRAVLVYEPALD